ncbi:hypothetical protein HanHA300_Chr11g0416651 [Helianthus annuus]|nr:hypothetical protein HanHA300_Chr11g0416651 [Helianthus annuus]KAJ0518726.1 hypothetical protein HanHA89_Chr11g0440681 [Helianthus annuus]
MKKSEVVVSPGPVARRKQKPFQNVGKKRFNCRILRVESACFFKLRDSRLTESVFGSKTFWDA